MMTVASPPASTGVGRNSSGWTSTSQPEPPPTAPRSNGSGMPGSSTVMSADGSSQATPFGLALVSVRLIVEPATYEPPVDVELIVPVPHPRPMVVAIPLVDAKPRSVLHDAPADRPNTSRSMLRLVLEFVPNT